MLTNICPSFLLLLVFSLRLTSKFGFIESKVVNTSMEGSAQEGDTGSRMRPNYKGPNSADELRLDQQICLGLLVDSV